MLFGLLGPDIARLRLLEPGVTLDVVVSNEVSDLSLREADVAIRPSASPDDHLVGHRLGVIRQSVYAHRSLGLENGPPSHLNTLPWIGPSSSMAYRQFQAWFRRTGCDDACICRVNSVLGMHAAVRATIGVAVLPCYLADPDPDLMRIGDMIDDISVDLWLLAHPDLRSTARVRAVLDHFGNFEALL